MCIFVLICVDIFVLCLVLGQCDFALIQTGASSPLLHYRLWKVEGPPNDQGVFFWPDLKLVAREESL